MKQPKDLELLDQINLILKDFSMAQLEGVSEIFLDSEKEEMDSIFSFFSLTKQLSEEGRIILIDKLIEKLKSSEEEEY